MHKIIAPLAMGLVILLSNILVQIPFGKILTYGAFTYPLIFLVTDTTNRVYGAKEAYKAIAVGFILGAIFTIFAGDMRIAIASCAAFVSGQVLDVTVFNRLRQLDWWKAPLASSTFSSVTDTVIFFAVAFWGTGVPWVQLGSGDLAVKFLMALCLLTPYRMLVNWILKN